MKFRNFLGVAKTSQQAYFKEGVELLYPNQKKAMHLAILPAYDPKNPKPTGWIPAVMGDEESDFYTTVRAAKFVGHGNRRAKTSFLSPKTFDLNADDPYEAFVDYCTHSDMWSYLTKDARGHKITGEIEGAVFPPMKNFFVANVVDFDAGARGGVFVTELSESVARSLLYSIRKDGKRQNGIAFEVGENGERIFGDITDPNDALVVEVAFGAKGWYFARPAVYADGRPIRMKIPETLLQHRQHMEDPETFLIHPGSGQDIVDRLAGMLRGYKHPQHQKVDELEALKEAMKFAYGEKYLVDDNIEEAPDRVDPFGDVSATVSAEPEKKAEAVSEAVDRGVAKEKYTPPENPPMPKSRKKAKAKVVPMTPESSSRVIPMTPESSSRVIPMTVEAPGEDIDPSDIANVRAMLLGGKS